MCDMASVDLFNNPATSPIPTIQTTAIESLLPMDNTNSSIESLSINDIRLFESLELNSSGSSGIGNSNEAIIDGSLDETVSPYEDASQYCKICK